MSRKTGVKMIYLDMIIKLIFLAIAFRMLYFIIIDFVKYLFK